MIKKALLIISALILISCGAKKIIEPADVTPEPVKKEEVRVDVSSVRDDKVLSFDIAIGSNDFEYTAELSVSGRKAVVILKNNKYKMGNLDICRPVSKFDITDSENGMKFEIYLANKNTMKQERIGNWIRLTFRALEPDMEMAAMAQFGPWIRPLLAASEYRGVNNREKSSELIFDSYPAYAYGKVGKKYYLDIFGVKIPAGNLKYRNVSAVTTPEGKTRIVLKSPTDFCVDNFNITLGKKCGGYSSLFGFKKEIKKGSESFSFNLTGHPPVFEKKMKGLSAFGIKNVKLFGEGMQRYEDDRVYKVETRFTEDMVWLVFLHEPEMTYDYYYKGDKFFIVFH